MTELTKLCAIIEAKILAIEHNGHLTEDEKGYVRALKEIKEYVEKKFYVDGKGVDKYLSSLVSE